MDSVMPLPPNSVPHTPDELRKDIAELEELVRRAEGFRDYESQLAKSVFLQLVARKKQELAARRPGDDTGN